ncbi:MAG: hypothetical protein IIU23_08500, partial [Bacteroidales bacterium]|nr:hypothetical protein [Bacteroidales bacterium]
NNCENNYLWNEKKKKCEKCDIQYCKEGKCQFNVDGSLALQTHRTLAFTSSTTPPGTATGL